jgi:hypothetical protein
MSEDPKQKNYVRFQIRVPPELHADLISAADRNIRTLNGEVVARLMGDPFAIAVAEQTRQTGELRELTRKILAAVEK